MRKKDIISNIDDLDVTKTKKIFQLMNYFIENEQAERKKITEKVNAIFQFNIKSPKTGKDDEWVLDLKNEKGGVSNKKSDNANVTFSMNEDTFVKVCCGDINPQVAFIQGKMKIKGNLGLATKFTPQLFPPISSALLEKPLQQAIQEYLQKRKQTTNESFKMSNLAKKFKSSKLLTFFSEQMSNEAIKNLHQKVNSSYVFEIIGENKSDKMYIFLDMKTTPPILRELEKEEFDKIKKSIKEKKGNGTRKKSDVDCIFSLHDNDFVKIATNQLNPQMAFLKKQITLEGDLSKAMKFTPNLFPKISSL